MTWKQQWGGESFWTLYSMEIVVPSDFYFLQNIKNKKHPPFS